MCQDCVEQIERRPEWMQAGSQRYCCHGDRLHGELGQVMMTEKVWSDLGSNEEVNQQDFMTDSIDSIRGVLRGWSWGFLVLSCEDQDACH